MTALMLTVALLANVEDANAVLRCPADAKGRFEVTQKQWDFVRSHLTCEKIGVLLHPKHGVNERAVAGVGFIWKSWSGRDDILFSLTPAEIKKTMESDNGLNPYLALDNFFNSKSHKTRKIDYRTWEVVPADEYDKRLRREAGPFQYLRLMRADKRLWLGEVSFWTWMELKSAIRGRMAQETRDKISATRWRMAQETRSVEYDH